MTPLAVSDLGEALRLSALVAAWTTVATAGPAVLLGWLLARRAFRGKAVVTTLVYAPLVLPPVVTGFLLLRLLGRRGPVGAWLAAHGIQVPFTLAGAVVASAVVGLPLFVAVVRAAFEAVDRRHDEVAATLGLSPWATFRRVTLPLAAPGVAAGAMLAFARALGEFGATIVLAGNVEGETQTLALAVYALLDAPTGEARAGAYVLASLGLALASMLAYELLVRRHRRLLELDRGR